MFINSNNNENNNNNNQILDESEFTIEKVESVLKSFYFPQNNDYSSLPQIQEWLMQFQRSFSAWSISPMLLMSNITEIQYFGASTIENKIKTNWLSLNQDLKIEFLDKLLSFLKTCVGNNCSNIVITRLCLAVSVIACHSTPELWSNPILDVLQLSFPDINNLDSFNPNTLNLTLELLTIFPEELTNSDYITQEKRNKVGLLFNKHNSKIFEIICKIMTLQANQQSIIFMKSSLRCFKSWILFDCPAREYLVESQIIIKCFEAVSNNPMLVEEFLLVLDELFTFMGGKIFRSYPMAFNLVLEKILIIFPKFYLMAIQEDNQIFNQIFLLFSHVAENHIKILLKNSELSNSYFKAVIQMALKGDFETCELLAPVVTEIAVLDDNTDNDISGWYQYLGEIVEVFRLKSMYPINQDISELFEEDKERFFEFRRIAGDVILEVYGILDGGKILQQLLNTLWSDIQSFPSTQCWQSIESTVYLLGCLSEGITENAAELIPQLFSILGQLPIQSTPLIKSTMVLAGKYSNLIDKSTLFLEKIVRDFFPAFENQELKSVASQAFLSISKNIKCSQLLSNGINQLINFCTPVLFKNNTIIDDPSNFNIMEALLYIISVLPSNNEILNYSTQLLSPYIFYIKNYTIQHNQQQQQQQQSKQQQKSNLSLLLSSINLLTDFCKIYDDQDQSSSSSSSESSNNNNNETQQNTDSNDSSNNNRPVYQIINNIIPIYGELLNLNKLENSILESISSFYKIAMMISNNNNSNSNNNNNNIVNIPEINRQLTLAFLNQTPQSLILNSLSISIINLPKEQQLNFLSDSISSISNKMVEIWRNNSNSSGNSMEHNGNGSGSSSKKSPIKKEIENKNQENNGGLGEYSNFNISIYPDITKEYFSLLTQYIKYNVVSIPNGVVSTLFSIILSNITSIHDKVTARACFSFMSLIITKSKEMKDQPKWELILNEINNWLNLYGELLVKQVLYSAGGGIPRSVVQFIADVIASLVNSYPEVFRISAFKCLSIDGFPSNNITKEQKEKFINSIMLNRSKKVPLKLVQDFSLISLGVATNQSF